MKLWLITQSENDDYDAYNSAVVAAPDETTAKTIHPNGWGCGVETWSADDTWASSPTGVTAAYIGEAKEGTPIGVILSSFTAG